MKAGLTQMVYALQTLNKLKLTPKLAPVVLVNSDEETGSLDSRSHIRRFACQSSRVYVLEPSLGPTGKLKTARKGVGEFTITIRGRAAHAGLEPETGASAILELSFVIQKLHDLHNPGRGITINVGIVRGGQRVNIVAPECRAQVDVRAKTRREAKRIEQLILGLRPVTQGVTLQIDGAMDRPPMEQTPRNRRLWEIAREMAARMNLTLEEGSSGGASDGNFTSETTATLDGLGAVGDGAHAPHEFIYVDKLLERTALLVHLLLAPPP
jgi:glutamate carboxypeptidase